MKKLFLILIFASQFIICQAATVPISISGFVFSPATVTVQVNDVITWTNQDNAPHSIVSTSVPVGAATFSSSNFGLNGTFSYTVTVAGAYSYICGVHPSMKGSFSTSATTPVVKPLLSLNTLYPNPCIDYIHIESVQDIKEIEVYSEAGALLETHFFLTNKIDLVVSNLKKGIYFIRIESSEGLVETRRIVKI